MYVCSIVVFFITIFFSFCKGSYVMFFFRMKTRNHSETITTYKQKVKLKNRFIFFCLSLCENPFTTIYCKEIPFFPSHMYRLFFSSLHLKYFSLILWGEKIKEKKLTSLKFMRFVDEIINSSYWWNINFVIFFPGQELIKYKFSRLPRYIWTTFFFWTSLKKEFNGAERNQILSPGERQLWIFKF